MSLKVIAAIGAYGVALGVGVGFPVADAFGPELEGVTELPAALLVCPGTEALADSEGPPAKADGVSVGAGLPEPDPRYIVPATPRSRTHITARTMDTFRHVLSFTDSPLQPVGGRHTREPTIPPCDEPRHEPSGLGYPARMDSPSRPDWRRLLVLYWITSVVEGIGVSQIYAFLPTRLAEVGMSKADIGHVLGLLFSLFFLVGLPLIPLWGVWADKYSRKAVIIRSSLVEAAVFLAVAASGTPWQLAISMTLVGFQLGNSGVMIAAICDVTPRPRLGLAMGLFASSSPLGFGLGPAIGAVMISWLHYSSAAVFTLSAVLSLGVALMLAIGSAEVRPEVVPTGSISRLAYGAVRGVFADRTVRWLFAVSGAVFVGRQMALPYLPLLDPLKDPGTLGLVLFISAILGALLTPIAGWAADRIGFRPVLVMAVAGLSVAILSLGLAPTIVAVLAAATMQTALQAGVGSMVSGLLSVEVPSERRSATLNLIYLPLYFGGIVGPAIASIVYWGGLLAVFAVASGVLAGATLLALVFARRVGPAAASQAARTAEV